LGIIFGLFEYVGYINVSSLVRAKIFIDIVTSLLIFMISLQLVSNYKSTLIKISPVLLLITSLFYYNNIYYLVYTVLVLFAAINIIIAANTSLDIKQSAKYTFFIFVTSIPFVVVLFLVFPRISYQQQNFGFKGQSVKVSGFGDTVDLGEGEELLNSDTLVMEVSFVHKVPKADKLYFRGSVLYNYDGNRHWSILRKTVPAMKLMVDKKSLVSYDVTLYPTREKVLFSMDMPVDIPKNTYPDDAYIDEDFILKTYKPVNSIKHYLMTSATRYKILTLDRITRSYSLVSSAYLNPKTRALAKSIMSKSKNDEEILQNIIKFFKESNFTYTLKPEKLVSKDKVDEILFKTKEGYCVHFATAFAILARDTKLPTRLVSGYKADYKERVNNYILIREKNAHTWDEVYIKNKGWVRVDPTVYAFVKNSTNEDERIRATSSKRIKENITLSKKIYLYMMYVKYTIDNWVLNYDYFKQLRILNAVEKNRSVLLYFLFIFAGLVAMSYFSYKYFFLAKEEDKLLKEYRRLLEKLEKKGYKKEHYEGALTFLKRIESISGLTELKNITDLYVKLRYKEKFSKEKYRDFKRMIKKFKL
jgi:transglutaminase-like putative cysteine protease